MRYALLGLALVLGCTDDTLVNRADPNAPLEHPEVCVAAETPCAVEFLYPIGGVEKVELRGDFAAGAWESGVAMQVDGAAFRTELSLPQGTSVRYKFFINGSEWVTDPLNQAREPDGIGGENSVVTAECGYNLCPIEVPPPVAGSFDWRSAVMYFVFVDRFLNGEPGNDLSVSGVEAQANYRGGDYAGVIEKIRDGYFESLGVNALWLTVPMDNPNTPGMGTDGHLHTGYHGYWPSDLERVEEHFGSLDELSLLVEEAHARGIKVLLDYAMNHVHSANPLFTQHPEWFWPLDYNGAQCLCGGGCDWNDEYEQKRCWFTDYLPDWNFQNDQARAFSVDNALKWIADTGADGFRLDAVKHIELSWLLDLRARVSQDVEPQSGEHFYMVGETFESGNRDILKYYVGADKLDGQFDFPLRAVAVEVLLRRSGTMYDLDSFLATNDGYYPGIMSTFLGNHDIGRIIHVAEDQPWDAWAKGDPWGNPPPLPSYAAPFERLAVAFTFLFTTKGIPLVYYGDEIGLPGAGDPDNRRPMQWDSLSEHQLMLRTQLEKLGKIRRDHPALWRGVRTSLSVTNDTYSYRMADDVEAVYVALNRSDVAAAVQGMPEKGRDLLSGAVVEGPQLNLPPRTAMIIVPES